MYEEQYAHSFIEINDEKISLSHLSSVFIILPNLRFSLQFWTKNKRCVVSKGCYATVFKHYYDRRYLRRLSIWLDPVKYPEGFLEEQAIQMSNIPLFLRTVFQEGLC